MALLVHRAFHQVDQSSSPPCYGRRRWHYRWRWRCLSRGHGGERRSSGRWRLGGSGSNDNVDVNHSPTSHRGRVPLPRRLPVGGLGRTIVLRHWPSATASSSSSFFLRPPPSSSSRLSPPSPSSTPPHSWRRRTSRGGVRGLLAGGKGVVPLWGGWASGVSRLLDGLEGDQLFSKLKLKFKTWNLSRQNVLVPRVNSILKKMEISIFSRKWRGSPPVYYSSNG